MAKVLVVGNALVHTTRDQFLLTQKGFSMHYYVRIDIETFLHKC